MTAQNSLELQGNFLAHPFAEILIEICRAGFAGSLRLSFEEKKTIVYFENGKVAFAVSNAEKLRLFDLLQTVFPEKVPLEMTKFSNDLELLENLRADSSFSGDEISNLLSRQLEGIIIDVLSWQNGDWKFDPLARARSDFRADVDLSAILLDHARSLSFDCIGERFRSFTETFAQLQGSETKVALDPSEAFVLSRLQTTPLTVNDILASSGIGDAAVLKILYSLWLAGLLVRSDWNPAFSEIKINSIRSATLILKKRAASIGKTAKMVEPEVVETKPKPQKAERTIPVDEYLKQVEAASSFYDVLCLSHDCSLSAIRTSYFSLAKQFHPDKFHRDDPKNLRRIEVAFSSLAQAYETLKDPKSRELYDSKLKRERAERANRDETPAAGAAPGGGAHSERAAQEFEHGRGLLMDGEWQEALTFLARAVHFVPDNPRYHAFYGKALAQDENQRHKAVNAMQKAVTLDPQNAAFRMMLAEFLIKVNLVKRAEGELNRLLAQQPDHKEARSLLDSLSRK